MADQTSTLLVNADSRRDSYGFAVRPQHLHRYREYGNIYKEEEEERSEKWINFLQQCSQSSQPGAPAEEPVETSEALRATKKVDGALENSVEGNNAIGEDSTSASSIAGDAGKEVAVTKEKKRRNVKTWAPIRSSLVPIEQIMSVRVKNNVHMSNERLQLVHVPLPPLPPMGKEFSARKFFAKDLEEKLPDDEFASDNGSVNFNAVEGSMESKSSPPDCFEIRETSDLRSQEVEIPANIIQTDSLSYGSSHEEEASANENKEGLENTVDYSSNNEPFFPWKEELESLVHGGIPKSLRGEVWQAFVGVKARRVERYYQKLLSVGLDSIDSKHQSAVAGNGLTASAPEKWRKQIEKDLPRTFPGHPALDEEGRNSLRRILVAYARHNPSVGYCQAMNFFAGLLLLLMPEENAFWTLIGIIDDYFDGYYTHEMIESQVDQLVFEELMRERFPKLVNHLDYLGVEVAWVSGPWFLSIFVNMLPWESVLRVWDVILYEGNRVMLFRTALALMELYGPALVTTKDAADAISLLQSLTGSTFDSSQLVFTACMGFLGVTETRLEELRTKHRPSVLGIIDDRTKGTEVSKDSKSLASKLYSFKQEAQALIKESNPYGGLSGKLNDSARSEANASPDNFDEFMCALSAEPEVDSAEDHQEQVVWLKVELCRLMEEQRLATLRAEELETAFLEMVKQDNRRELSARVEQLEQEVGQLRQALRDKQEQELAMVQVLMRVEQEQKVTEDARIAAEQEAAAQKHAAHVLQEKYDKAIASLAEMEKRVVMAESMLQATLQYESGQAKALTSPRSTRTDSPQGGRRTGLLSFGLGWRDKNKGRASDEEDQGENR